MSIRAAILGLILGSLVLQNSMGAPAEPKAAAIVGGIPSTKNAWPWFATIQRLGIFRCGGILIGRRLVVTASHCVEDSRPSQIKVIVGDYRRTELDTTQKSVAVSYFHTHPYADLVVLELSCKPDLSEAVKVSKLYNGNWPEEGTYMAAVGFGWTRSGDSNSLADKLQERQLPIASTEACSKELTGSGGAGVRGHEFCAGFPNGTYSNVCHGDSGGPLFYRPSENAEYQLAGIVVRGPKSCPETSHFAVFIKVPHGDMLSFIQKQIDSVPDGTSCTSETDVPVKKKSSCFPGNAMVTIPGGLSKRMEDVRRGDKVLSMSPGGALVYSDVIMVLHSNADATEEYYVIDTGSETIRLSAKHMILTKGYKDTEAIFKFAQNVQVGDFVFIREWANTTANTKRVTSIEISHFQGLFAPVTLEGTIVVDQVVASCYAYMESQTTCHAVFAPARVMHSWMPAVLDWGESVPPGGVQDHLHWYPHIVATISGPVLSLAGMWV